MDTKMMTKTALITAIICILAPLSIPIGSIPISFTNLVLYFAVYIIGTKYTTLSYIIYMLLGIAGLPVFSGFQGGIGKVMGPTGGYLVGFVFMIIISGIFIKKFKSSKLLHLVGMILGTLAAYAFGTVWFSIIMEKTLMQSFVICVAPFLIGDFLKMIIALYAGGEISKRIK